MERAGHSLLALAYVLASVAAGFVAVVATTGLTRRARPGR
jgi:hypothetical protein